jgi:hypothetical protein
MSFTFKIAQPPLEISFEAGSIGEGLAILKEGESQIKSAFEEIAKADGGNVTDELPASAAAPEGEKRTRKPRGPNKAAPPPAPVPVQQPAQPAQPASNAPPPPPLPNAPSLVPEVQKVAAVAPPPPAAVAPAPLAPPATPSISLAEKVVAELNKRREGAADGGQFLADWLATAGIIAPGAQFDEALTVLKLCTPDQVAPVADALGVS